MTDLDLTDPTPAVPALQSATIGAIAGALAKAQGAMRHAAKDSLNPHFKNKYADLAGVIDASRHALAANDIGVIQRNLPADRGVCVQTVLVHKSGEWISDAGLYVPASKTDAQGYGSALTYARRYGLSALVGVAQDDDDGNDAAKSAPAAPAAKSAPARTPKKLNKAQTDTLVGLLMKAGRSEQQARESASVTKPEQFDRAIQRAGELVEAYEAAQKEAGDDAPAEAPAVDTTTGEVQG